MAAPATTRAPRRAKPAADTPDRRQNILLAAEKLFGLRGYHAVSIRDIATEAGVPLALVGYYFGAKHELYHAIFESWRGSIDQRIAALQAAANDLTAPDVLERVLAAWVMPLVELARHPTGQYYALMAARDLASPTAESERAQAEFFDPMAHAYIDTLQRLFPRSTRGEIAWCYQFMLGAVLHYLTDVRVERLSRGENRATSPEGQRALLDFIAAGFRGVLRPG